MYGPTKWKYEKWAETCDKSTTDWYTRVELKAAKMWLWQSKSTFHQRKMLGRPKDETVATVGFYSPCSDTQTITVNVSNPLGTIWYGQFPETNASTTPASISDAQAAYYSYQCYQYVQHVALTEAQLRRIEEDNRQNQLRRKAASERAQLLLRSILNSRQREQLDRDNTFDLEVGVRLYRISPGRRVERINRETGKIESYFCIHPSHIHDLPPEDWAISQKLLLETDEAAFLRTANETAA